MKPWIAPALVVFAIITVICIGSDRRDKKNGTKSLSAFYGWWCIIKFAAFVTAYCLIVKFTIDVLNLLYPHKP